MYYLESKSVLLHPLSVRHLKLLVSNREKLEKELNLNRSEFELNADASFIDEFNRTIHDVVIPNVEENFDNYMWYTHWLIIQKSHKIIAGGIGVAGEPDRLGQTYLGYFIEKKFENQGLATESVGCFIEWMNKNPLLKSIIADTPANHIASQKVLKKNGFKIIDQVDEGIRWELKINSDN